MASGPVEVRVEEVELFLRGGGRRLRTLPRLRRGRGLLGRGERGALSKETDKSEQSETAQHAEPFKLWQ